MPLPSTSYIEVFVPQRLCTTTFIIHSFASPEFLDLKIWRWWLLFFILFRSCPGAFPKGRISTVLFNISLLSCTRWPSQTPSPLRHASGQPSGKAFSESPFVSGPVFATWARVQLWFHLRGGAPVPEKRTPCPSAPCLAARGPLPDPVWQHLLSPFGKPAHL